MINELFGWAWITLGFITGALLGMYFQREDWLGGYASFPRRMIRLGHIALVALGALNVLFAHTAPRLALGPGAFSAASVAMIVGGIAMPACCGLVAWRKGLRLLFAIPVVSLIAAGVLVCLGLIKAAQTTP